MVDFNGQYVVTLKYNSQILFNFYGLTTHLLTVVSLRGGNLRVSVIRYEPMLLFYQITSNFVSFNAKKQSAFCFPLLNNELANTIINYLMITILAFIVFMKREEQLN